MFGATKTFVPLPYLDFRIVELIISIIELIAIVCVPMICVGITIWSQKRYANQQIKSDLFQKLFLHRASPVFKRELADTLNAIQVVFPKNNEIREKWKQFHATVNTDGGRDLTDEEKATLNKITSDLLFLIASDIKIRNVTREDFDKIFYPRVLGAEELIERDNKALLNEYYAKSIAFYDYYLKQLAANDRASEDQTAKA